MKRTLQLVGIAIVFNSCAVQQVPVSANTVYLTDYRPYTEKGFFITELSSVSFPYDPIASITGVNRSVLKQPQKNEKTAYKDIKLYPVQQYTSATPEQAFLNLYNKAVEMGANGIVNPSVGDNYYASGFAIKIKSNETAKN